jgi:Ca2+/Na+ antiporter
MKYINLSLMFFISILIIVFTSSWIFNHVNAWAGIGSFVVCFYGWVAVLLKIIKKEAKIEDK